MNCRPASSREAGLFTRTDTYARREYYRAGDIYFLRQRPGYSNVTVTQR